LKWIFERKGKRRKERQNDTRVNEQLPIVTLTAEDKRLNGGTR